MPTSAALSNPKPPPARTTPKSATKTTGAPKRQGGRKVGAVKWTIEEFLLLLRVIAVRRPSGNNDWQAVSTEHNLGPTNRSSETCKSHWNQVLKLPKPMGRSRMHPLHRLALAIDEAISKANATHILNDADEHDTYGDLEDEFALAKSEMKRLKLDFKRPPNFNIPLPDEDAEVDAETDDEANAEGEGAGVGEYDGDGEEGDVDVPGDAELEVDEDAQDIADVPLANGNRQPSEAPTDLDIAGPSAPISNPEAAAHSPPWNLDMFDDQPRSPSPVRPPQPLPKTQATVPGVLTGNQSKSASPTKPKVSPAPFPMSKTSPAELGTSSKAPKVEPRAGNAPAKSSIEPTPRKRPVPKPMRPITPDQTVESKPLAKSKVAGSSSSASIEIVEKPTKSSKRKISGGDEQGGARMADKAPSKSSLSKASGSKGKEPMAEVVQEDIINLLSDEDDPFVKQYVKEKGVSNLASIAFMDHKRKIQRLETQLDKANQTILDLQTKIRDFEQEKKIEARVQEELARREQKAQLALAPTAPAPVAVHSTVGDLGQQFDPNHPFNRNISDEDMMLDMRPMH